MKALRIVFMGTPEFALTILKEIVASKHELVGVVTVADKPAGFAGAVWYLLPESNIIFFL